MPTMLPQICTFRQNKQLIAKPVTMHPRKRCKSVCRQLGHLNAFETHLKRGRRLPVQKSHSKSSRFSCCHTRPPPVMARRAIAIATPTDTTKKRTHTQTRAHPGVRARCTELVGPRFPRNARWRASEIGRRDPFGRRVFAAVDAGDTFEIIYGFG